MANYPRRGRSKRTLGPFIALERYLLNSPAWASLSPIARCALVELLIRYNGANNGRIAMSANVLAMLLPISRATAARALKELIERGFVEIVMPGGFSCKMKVATEYRLTFHRCDVTGDPPLKPFMRWRPENLSTVSPESSHGFTTEQRSRKAA